MPIYNTFIGDDGTWMPYRSEARFAEVLEGTARAFVALIEMAAATPSHRGTMLAYGRAVNALAQLPIEFTGSNSRFERSRWRASTVVPGVNSRVHCEHPWTKRRTRELVWVVSIDGLRRGAPRDATVSAVSGILAARQDTVLLPHDRPQDLGIRSGRDDDGLAFRYGTPIASGALVLIDRLHGTVVSTAAIEAVEAQAAHELESAIERVAGSPDTWSVEFRTAVERMAGGPAGAGLDAAEWVASIQVWLTAQLGVGTRYAEKGYLSVTHPAPRRRKGALHQYQGRGTPILEFRCARREHWLGALGALRARPGVEDRIQIPLPPGTPLELLNGVLAEWT